MHERATSRPRRTRTLAGSHTQPVVALLQTTIPQYRSAILEGLHAEFGEGLTVVAGTTDFEPTVRLGAHATDLVIVSNLFVAGRRLLWQRRCVRALLRPDVVVLELNPRIISTWAILALRRLGGRPALLWGHAWPRGGRGSGTDRLRHWMRLLSTGIVVYTDTQAQELATRMPGAVIRSAPNGLYPRRDAVLDSSHRSARNVLFVGRLVPAKKPRLLLDAFLIARDRLPQDAGLVFVGDGTLRHTLEERARAAGADSVVRFTGSLAAFETLRDIYRDALVSASPGYVGLSLIQSLWFGVPMIIARDEPHAPEIEAAQSGRNSVFVESDSVASLADAIVQAYELRDVWLSRGPEIARACVERYAIESTVDSLVGAIRESFP